MSVHISACWPFPWTDPCTDLDISSSFDGLDCPRTCDWKGGGSNLSDKGLNLSGSWQQGHSATYNTPRSERRFHRTDLANDTCLWEPKLLLRVGNRAAGACVASSPDSDLEAFSHNPAHGSFAPLAFQPSAMTNCANQRFLSY
ncbi:unnamed protein product [Brassica rapa]|uniref:Uncharacterized protein n=1 Tax=Brassica campestris TaxID=3711 RepID=A0A8D9GS90_BRACM|nr:unnamed protein product [Brassica rapa]CAG7885920.1 unnamed protein product [Brassica rapa]CAG7888780.1 unnamed protein product [Brassica rapa]